MKGSNIRRWGAALAVVIIAGAAYWFWHDRGTSGSGAPAAGQGPQGPGGARHGRFGAALAPVQAATATEEAVPRYLTGLGTVTAANTVTVRSRVDGQLLSLHFRRDSRSKPATCWRRSTPASLKSPSPGAGSAGERSGHPCQCPPRSRSLPAAGEDQPRLPPGARHSAVAGGGIRRHGES